MHFDNKENDILILGEGRTPGLYDIKWTSEGIYLINFTQPNKRLY